MTDKPEIKVGQIWITQSGHPVRILSTDGIGALRIVGQYLHTEDLGRWLFDGLSDDRLISLAPSTVKREVALYREDSGVGPLEYLLDTSNPLTGEYRRISEPLTIEFTLLPGESP
jgi:hypothetical protein